MDRPHSQDPSSGSTGRSRNESPLHLANQSSQRVSRVTRSGDGLLHRAPDAGNSEDEIQLLERGKSAFPVARCVVIMM